MSTSYLDNLEALSPAELAQMVRELREANAQLRSTAGPRANAAQGLLDTQLRRTSLLTQLAIEFRESGDPPTIVEQTLRAIGSHLVVAGASVILLGPGAAIELAYAYHDGGVEVMGAELAREVIDRGLAGWVVRHGSSVALSDVARDRRWLQFSERHASGSVIVIPVRQAGITLGVMTVHRATPYAFSSHDLILLEGVAAQLGVALSAFRHQASERLRRDQAIALLEMTQFLNAERSTVELAAVLQDKSVTVFGARLGLLFLRPADAGDDQAGLHPVLWPGGPAERDPLVEHAAGAARLAWGSQRITTTAPEPAVTCVALPLTHRGTTIGAYVLVHAGEVGFSASVWSLLTIVTHVIAAACASVTLVIRLTEQARILENLVEQRTRQMQRSRDVLRIVFDSLDHGILLLDSEEQVIAVNLHFCQTIMAAHPRELVGHSYAQIWQTLERRATVHIDLAPAEPGRRQRLQVRYDGPDGLRRFIIERQPVHVEGRKVEQYLEFWNELPA